MDGALRAVMLSVVSVVVLFLLTKLMGNKELSQMSMFDYVTGITIGSIAAELATEFELKWYNPVISMMVYGLLAVGISFLTNKSVKAQKILSGRPIVLMDNGVIFKKNLAKARMDVSDFLMMCRVQGCFDIGQIQTAILEFNGSLSLLLKSDQRPATPSDLNLSPQQEQVQVNLILDGKVNEANLKLVKHNLQWLEKRIKAQGYDSVSQIFLATCDANDQLALYPMENKKIAVDWFE